MGLLWAFPNNCILTGKNSVRTSLTVCTCVLLSVLRTQVAFAAPVENTTEPVVVVDPGHGTPDPGAVRANVYEKDINLKVSTELAELLAKRGFQVCMTRMGDHDFADPQDEKRGRRHRTDLVNRLAAIQHADGDAVISVHCNWSRNPSAEGAIVLFQPGNDEGARLAEQIYRSLHQANIKASAFPSASSIYLLKRTKEPCVLVELGFMSNNKEAGLLTDPLYQKRMASAIERGVSSYLEPHPSNSEPTPIPKYRAFTEWVMERVRSALGHSQPAKHGGVHVCPGPDDRTD